MSRYFRLAEVTWDFGWCEGPPTKWYHFVFEIKAVEIPELLHWVDTLPNQGQYDPVILINAMSDGDDVNAPTTYFVRTNLMGKALAKPFFERWRK